MAAGSASPSHHARALCSGLALVCRDARGRVDGDISWLASLGWEVKATLQQKRIIQSTQPPAVWHAVDFRGKFMPGESQLHEPLGIQQLSRLFEQSNTAAIGFN